MHLESHSAKCRTVYICTEESTLVGVDTTADLPTPGVGEPSGSFQGQGHCMPGQVSPRPSCASTLKTQPTTKRIDLGSVSQQGAREESGRTQGHFRRGVGAPLGEGAQHPVSLRFLSLPRLDG
jgi:hypothetical protein